MRIDVPISPGEYFDKLTILEIKGQRIEDSEKLANIRRENDALRCATEPEFGAAPELATLKAQLKAVNERLWDIEDAIRALDDQGDFGERFIELARAVYNTNDQRAALKREINDLLGSDIAEEKSYARHQTRQSA